MADRYVEINALEFWDACDVDVKVGFGEWGGEAWYVYFLADGSAGFLEDVTPCVDEVSVSVVASGATRAEDGVIIL